jgi:hypothetical protein
MENEPQKNWELENGKVMSKEKEIAIKFLQKGIIIVNGYKDFLSEHAFSRCDN